MILGDIIMDKFKELYNSDIQRYSEYLSNWNKKFHYYFRKIQTTKNRILLLWYKYKFKRLKQKNGIEIVGHMKVGKGLYLGHPYGIIINPNSIIGDNVNIHKGVSIGQENRGKRKGSPKIGNKVWIGINSAIVGNVTIGDDVLIAPNSFVNCDVPDHSVVFGNPCRIIHRDNATEGYINDIVE